MSVALTPTPDMAPWSTEVRSQSAYIRGGLLRAHRTPGAKLHTGFAVRADQAAGLIAALDQIITHPAMVEWSMAAPDAVGSNWIATQTTGGWIELANGTCHVYGADEGTGWVSSSVTFTDGSVSGEFELEYRDIRSVGRALGAVLLHAIADPIIGTD